MTPPRRSGVARRLLPALGLALAVATTACAPPTNPALSDSPIEVVGVSTYGTGTATFADMAAVADAITTEEGTKFRIITSDTAIGRVLPLKEDQVQFSRTGDEYIFAFRGEHDFSDPEWGPQPTRVVWAPTAPHSWLVKASSDIVEPADLVGKKVPRVTANPSVNQKTEAMLATAGLTWSDVHPVEIGYGEQAEALKAGKLDILFQQVHGASLFELEASTPVRWLRFDPADPATQRAIEEHAPSVRLDEFTAAPGQEEGETAVGFWYAVPVVTYAETTEVVARQMARAIVDSYDRYGASTQTTKTWSIDASAVVPVEVPFHPGLVAVLKEEGVWTPAAQRRQDQLLAQEKQLRAGWTQVTEELSDDGEIDDAELDEAWAAWKAENIDD